MRKAVLSIVGFLALAGIVGYVATWGGGLQSRESAGTGAASRAPEKAVGRVGSDEPVAGVPTPGSVNVEDAGPVAGGGLSPVGSLPPIGPDIVKTADISIEVKSGGFETAFNAATTPEGTAAMSRIRPCMGSRPSRASSRSAFPPPPSTGP